MGKFEDRGKESVRIHRIQRETSFPYLYKNSRPCRIDLINYNAKVAIECDGAYHFKFKQSDVERDRKVCRYFLNSDEWVLVRLHYSNNDKWHLYLDQMIAIISSNKEFFRGKIVVDHNEYTKCYSKWNIPKNRMLFVKDILANPHLQGIDPRGEDGDILMKESVVL